MTRNTTQATNALYALEAARAALRTADKTLSDALAIVERNCPREYGSKDGYDATHPTYQAYKRTREALEEARRYYYMEYLTTANGAVKRGDAETFWQTITRYATYSALPPNKSLYDDVNWAAAEAAGDNLCDCDTFRALAVDIANNHTLNSKHVIKVLEHLVGAQENRVAAHKLAHVITEQAASIIINSENDVRAVASAQTVFTDMCAHQYLMSAGDTGSSASKIGNLVITGDADNKGSLVIKAGRYHLNTRDADDLTKATSKWRNIIDNSVNESRRHVAKFAHMAITVTLLVNHNKVTAGDLAALIDMFQEYEDTHPRRDMYRIGFYNPKDIAHPIYTVEQLIDYAGSRMSVN